MISPSDSRSQFLITCPGYTYVETLSKGVQTIVYRAVNTETQQQVVIKVLRQEYARTPALLRFRNQYTIVQNLPTTGIIRPLSLEPCGHSYALIMEDLGGIALKEYAAQRNLALTEVLKIAIRLSDILHSLQQHRIVHKDIKPTNILIHPESKQVYLIDFSIASLVPRDTQLNQKPNTLEGTLAYLAPEQTGRMNRGIDHRADYYALGITLYQLLTGELPFKSEDALELIRCHMAQLAIPVHQVNSTVLEPISTIVAKLMAKNADERYQSALGLKHDLAVCLTQWEHNGTISHFELGQQDVCDRFCIPEKLYGRHAEMQTLLAAFDRVAQGSLELMMVTGTSGMGKTTLVNAIYKATTQKRGYFIQGKFDPCTQSRMALT